MRTLGDLNALVSDFAKAASLAGISLPSDAISYETLPAPHKPPSGLPEGKMAAYVFVWNGVCLKVGKVGPKSHARFTSQHYSPRSSNSNLAKSLVAAGGKNGIPVLSDAAVGEWIRTNVSRVNFLLSAKCGVPVLTLLESFLQCRLKPMFEGFESQR
jgi:hypothetical protein